MLHRTWPVFFSACHFFRLTGSSLLKKRDIQTFSCTSSQMTPSSHVSIHQRWILIILQIYNSSTVQVIQIIQLIFFIIQLISHTDQYLQLLMVWYLFELFWKVWMVNFDDWGTLFLKLWRGIAYLESLLDSKELCFFCNCKINPLVYMQKVLIIYQKATILNRQSLLSIVDLKIIRLWCRKKIVVG